MLENHPLRFRLVDEMHLRRMPALSPTICMLQTVRIVDAAERAAERAHVVAMPGVPTAAIVERPRDISGRADGGIEMTWERHSEASTTTVIAPSRAETPFTTDAGAALAWLEAAPGAVIRATKIAIVADEAAAETLLPSLDFRRDQLVSCRIGAMRIWSDFQLRDDGYGRLVVAGGDTPPPDLGRTIQRLQELGNYRNLALLGLPLAQSESASLTALEQRLDTITQRIAGASEGTEAALLDELCEVAAKAAAIDTGTGFRMSATRAYAQIVHDRLESLGATEIPGYQSLGDFTDRRMLPAIRTCASFVQRLEALSVRIERTTSLLRTRVDMAMQFSNAALLRSMDANAARQLKLQHLVEGLSVVAVSYYAFSLIAKLFPLVEHVSGVPEDRLQAALVLPVIILVAIYLRWRARIVTGGTGAAAELLGSLAGGDGTRVSQQLSPRHDPD